MAFGLGVLKLSPVAFWGLTLRELEAALIGHHGRRPSIGEAPTRADLARLMARHPDSGHQSTERVTWQA